MKKICWKRRPKTNFNFKKKRYYSISWIIYPRSWKI